MKLTLERVLSDIAALPENYKTADVDRLIGKYVSAKADASELKEYILEYRELHRIYFYVSLKQIKSARERMRFIDANLLFSDWRHTDQLIRFAADLDFDEAIEYARRYVASSDTFVRRFGYVMFISKLCRGRAKELFELLHEDNEYYVRMGEAWLIAELAVFEPEVVLDLLRDCSLSYEIIGRAIQKICDSYRVSADCKGRFKSLRPTLMRKERLL